EVEPLVDLNGLVQRAAGGAATFVLHEEATDPLAGADLPADGDVLLVVGPEGGITPDELAALTDAGAQVVRLGHTVLRSSSAGPAAIAVLSASGRWR
ncbi:MAG: RNA methyltransferase, partial [Intrasporangiaceae bacterium]|nr:RNA methyltransferase [Intrasporangiaceae bacterium]